ncbi:MAG: tetratricopeptide repeat protein [Pseudomonadota bacterium]
MSQPDDSFMREVQEEVRREQLARAFDKYGVLAIAGAVLILALVGGWLWYQAYTTDAAQKAGARFAAAQRLLRSDADADKATALKDFQEIAQTGPANYKALAQLQIAARMLDQDKPAEAKAAFDAVIKLEDIDPALKSYARLQLIALDADTLEYDALAERLRPLMAPDTAWRYSAREMLAVKAVSANRTDDARQMLGELLADQAAPPSIRRRAEMMMALITVPSAPKSETPETAPSQTPAPQTPAPKTDAGTTPTTDDTQPSRQNTTPADPTQAKDTATDTDDTKKPETTGSSTIN